MIQSEGGQMPLTAKECDSNLLSVKCKKRASFLQILIQIKEKKSLGMTILKNALLKNKDYFI